MLSELKSVKVLPWIVGTVCIGLIASSLATWAQARRNDDVAQRELTATALRTANSVLARLELYQYGLRGARGAVLTAGENGITRELFVRYSRTRDIDAEFPGARGFGFIRRVPREREAQFLQRARADDAPNFTIRELEPFHGERYIIQYIEPVERNREAVGLDIATEANRRMAAETALLTGQTTLTAPITLVQASGEKQQSFLLLMPIYRSIVTPGDVAARSTEAFGWSYTPLTMKEILEEVDVDRTIYRLRLSDTTQPGRREQFYDTGASNTPDNDDDDRVLRHSETRDVFGRRWVIELSAQPDFAHRLNLMPPRAVLAIGLVTTLLGAALAAALSLNRRRKLQFAESQTRLAMLVENSSDAIVVENADGMITLWNSAAERLLGFSATLALGQNLHKLIVPMELSKAAAAIKARVMKNETISSLDTQCLNRAGELVDVSMTVSAMREADGRVSGAAIQLRDIRPRKAEERRLREFSTRLEIQVAERTAELKRLNVLLSDVLRAASEVSIIATDVDGTIRIFNRGAEQLLGYSAADMVGKATPATFHLPAEVQARGAELTREYGIPIEGFRVFVHKPEIQGAEKREWTYVRKDGRHVQVSLVVTAMRDDMGAITGYLGIAEDITERKRAASALQSAKVAAEAANVAKSRFLATMSHELRTPLNGILGMAQMLQQPGIGEAERDQYTQIIIRSGNTLLTLLNDILDFSKIEAGKLELEAVPFSPEAKIASLTDLFALTAQQKGLTLSGTWHGPKNQLYMADAFRIRQMLTNLVSNALKFTAQGHVSIDIRERARYGQSVEMEFSVTDTGIGLAPEKRALLFQPFSQTESATTRQFGGTGLGLSIVRSLALLMGGEAGVESELGKGSRFWFRIPVTLAAADGSSAGAKPAGLKSAAMARNTAAERASDATPATDTARIARVLIAEDVPTNQAVIQAMLGKLGIASEIVDNGQKAVDALMQGRSFDAVLMDVQMPVMDGTTATQHIRTWERQQGRAPIPIIALTAGAYEDDRNRCLAAGMTDFLTKPLDLEVLKRVLATVAAAPRP